MKPLGTRMGSRHSTGRIVAKVMWTGKARVPAKEMRAQVAKGWLRRTAAAWGAPVTVRYSGEWATLYFAPKENLVVDSGVTRSLDRLFNRPSGSVPTPVVRMGVDNGATNPTASTDQSGANTKTLLAFDSEPTRTGKVVTCVRTFTHLNANFVWKRVFLSAHTADITNSTSADTAGTLYSMTNASTGIDWTVFSTFSQTLSATVTGAGS